MSSDDNKFLLLAPGKLYKTNEIIPLYPQNKEYSQKIISGSVFLFVSKKSARHGVTVLRFLSLAGQVYELFCFDNSVINWYQKFERIETNNNGEEEEKEEEEKYYKRQ